MLIYTRSAIMACRRQARRQCSPTRPVPMPPACVSQLRVHGFKTFTDPVALDILPDLTGGSVKNLERYAASWTAEWPNSPSSAAALT